VVFYAAQQVRIENNWFWDSAPKPVEQSDRYAIVSVREARRAKICRSSTTSSTTCGKSITLDEWHRGQYDKSCGKDRRNRHFYGGNNAVAEDYRIVNNEGSIRSGGHQRRHRPADGQRLPVSAHYDCRQSSDSNQDGRIRRKIGTPDNSKRTHGNLFENIDITTIIFASKPPRRRPIGSSSATLRPGSSFNGLTVSGNGLRMKGRPPRNLHRATAPAEFVCRAI
jgi:hypothetical protein